jgi:hypothetical protein
MSITGSVLSQNAMSTLVIAHSTASPGVKAVPASSTVAVNENKSFLQRMTYLALGDDWEARRAAPRRKLASNNERHPRRFMNRNPLI